MTIAVGVLAAVVAGLVVALVVSRQQREGAATLVADLRDELAAQREQLEAQRDASVSSAIDRLVTMAREQLGAHTEAGTRALDTRNEVMGERIQSMHEELDRVRQLVSELERDRQRRFGQLTAQLEETGRTTAELAGQTRALREALASPQARGQWGERMADDVLRAAGMVEGVNYVRQATTGGRRPDFTFLLPEERHVHMDVKFPLDNYLRALEADTDRDRADFEKAFLRDVKNRVKELTGRGYIDPAAGTLDYLLLFIPNEHIYAFVHQRDGDLLDYALANKVVMCSPVTLFSVLAVIREAADNFALERTSGQILECLTNFSDQWERFVEQMEKVGARIESTRKEYETLAGTRRRMLERQLDKIEELRVEPGIEGARVLALPEREDVEDSA
ncbi:MAG: DNA recombination protein RmuC [Nitriliruptorales bacterium]|nr:DNA recombination protein RmuC [Nitriliruptorales bacterium]